MPASTERSAAALLASMTAFARAQAVVARGSVQELGREANTLRAKSNDAALTAIGLDLRTRIEQFRKQVQNLE